MSRFEITKELAAARCEVCHQVDCFDLVLNACSRCDGVIALIENQNMINMVLPQPKPFYVILRNISVGFWRKTVVLIMLVSLFSFWVTLGGTLFLGYAIGVTTFIIGSGIALLVKLIAEDTVTTKVQRDEL